jgi:hypothetical protein
MFYESFIYYIVVVFKFEHIKIYTHKKMSAIQSDKITSIISYNFRTFPRTIKLFAECFGIQTIEPIPKFRSKIVNSSGVIIGYIDYGKYNLQEFLNTLRCCVNNIYFKHINGYMLYGDGRPIKTYPAGWAQ